MKTRVRIYLSGSIKKGRRDDRAASEFWTEKDESEIRRLVSCEAVLLNPAKSPIARNDFFVNYGCDLFLVESADLILADLRAEKGIGVGAELMYAAFIGRPVIGWLPSNTYYRRDKVEDVFGEDLVDWTHPFAFALCDDIVNSLDEACVRINERCAMGEFSKDTSKSPEKAIAAFRRAYKNLALG